jgi:hypothetical protein
MDQQNVQFLVFNKLGAENVQFLVASRDQDFLNTNAQKTLSFEHL